MYQHYFMMSVHENLLQYTVPITEKLNGRVIKIDDSLLINVSTVCMNSSMYQHYFMMSVHENLLQYTVPITEKLNGRVIKIDDRF